MSSSGFSHASATPGSMIESVQSLTAIGHHQFVADDVSLLDDSLINPTRLLASKQVTDAYLLALAVRNDAMLATFDRRISTAPVHGGADHILYLP